MKFSIFKRKYNKEQKSRPLFLTENFPSYNRAIENNATVFSAIDRIASTISGLSLSVYKAKDDSKTEHTLADVLYQPNIDETHSTFFYGIVNDIYTAGNAYLYIYRNTDGDVSNLFRIDPKTVEVKRDDFNRKIYLVNGTEYTASKILQINSRWGYNGLKGKSIFDVCRETFDTAQSLDDFTNNSFSNSLGKRLVIDLQKAFPNATETEQMALRERYLQNYSGSQNSGKPLIKTAGVDYSVLDTGTNTNQASELAENKNYQIKILSQIFGIPLEMLDGTGSSDLEKLTTLFATQAIQPIVQQLEESFQRLFKVEERGKYYIRFNYNSLLRTSLASKIDSYVKQMNNGILTINEIRKKENLPELADGNTAYRPSNLLPVKEELDNALGSSAKLKQMELENIEQPTQTQKNGEAVGLGSELMQ